MRSRSTAACASAPVPRGAQLWLLPERTAQGQSADVACTAGEQGECFNSDKVTSKRSFRAVLLKNLTVWYIHIPSIPSSLLHTPVCCTCTALPPFIAPKKGRLNPGNPHVMLYLRDIAYTKKPNINNPYGISATEAGHS